MHCWPTLSTPRCNSLSGEHTPKLHNRCKAFPVQLQQLNSASILPSCWYTHTHGRRCSYRTRSGLSASPDRYTQITHLTRATRPALKCYGTTTPCRTQGSCVVLGMCWAALGQTRTPGPTSAWQPLDCRQRCRGCAEVPCPISLPMHCTRSVHPCLTARQRKQYPGASTSPWPLPPPLAGSGPAACLVAMRHSQGVKGCIMQGRTSPVQTGNESSTVNK